MKSWFNIYIFIALYCFGMVSCTDESMVNDDSFDKVVVRMTLSVPGADSRVGGDYQLGGTKADSLDANILQQLYIDDVYILLFENKQDGTLIDFTKATLNGDQGDVTRTIEGKFSQRNSSINIVVLANLEQNGLVVDFTDYKGETEQAIYEALVYEYPKAGWKLDENARFLPMWGKQTNITLSQREININEFYLYRGVAKMGVQVATTAQEKFTLKEVYVYNVNSKGYCAAPTKRPDVGDTNNNKNDQFEEPEIPAVDGAPCVQLSAPLEYKNITNNAIHNQIYLSESNNKNPGTDRQPLVVVVGGIYNGDGLVENNGSNLTYYRIDMKDDKEATTDGVLAPFDIIRNHSYIFNITAVNNPGTPTPEEALDEAVVGLTVEVKDYTEVPMQGITPQYTLTVDNSTFGFEGLTITPGLLEVKTDGTNWELEKPEDGNNTWFELTEKNKTENSGQVSILPSPNTDKVDGKYVSRTGYFYVTAGKIKKRITVIQEPCETANCYIVRVPGDYLLKTDIKGNGNGQAWNDNTGTNLVDISLGTTGLKVDKVAILWETAAGLVTIKTDTPDKNGLITYQVHDQTDQWNASVFAPGHGGNALIGGFKNNGTTDNPQYELVWSWHIWVVGDFADGIKTEHWVTDYEFMDRYLGAYSNQPGVRSLGLLYQWGRKDPFIGAENVGEVRAHSEIVKADTENYTVYGKTYSWGDWTNGEEENVQNSILNPTKILKSGFLSTGTGIDEFNPQALWGTTSSSIDVKENGVKTLYDPCPVGYRVPSVHSWIFKRNNNRTNLYNSNYYYNSRYVPYQGYDGIDAGKTSYGSESFTSESPYYGFWVDYTVNESSTAPAIVKFGEGNDRTKWGTVKASQTTPLTWLPLGGVYSGTMNSFAQVGGYSSLQANSIVWLNAPSAYNPKRPAGVFLHGTEGKYDPNFGGTPHYEYDRRNGEYKVAEVKESAEGDYIRRYNNDWYYYEYVGNENIGNQTAYEVTFEKDSSEGSYRYINGDSNGTKGSGRHLHRLNEEGESLLALPQYAGSIRCIRDKDAIKSSENVINKSNLTWNTANGYQTEIELDAVESWQVSNPGAKWIAISPDRGSAGQDQKITITSTDKTQKGTATIIIRFARGSEKTITVTQE